jgi:Ca2+-binding RTX toxin-like protein
VTGPITATGANAISLTGRNILVTGNITSAAGDITLRNNNDIYQTGAFDGVLISGAAVNVNTTSGSIVIDGRGGSNTANKGVNLTSAKVQAGGSGCVTITGLSGNGTSVNSIGIYASGATVTTSTGLLTINGTSCGTGTGSKGVYLKSSANISATDAGNVTITGSTPGNLSTGLGIHLFDTGSKVYSNTGLITLNANSMNLTGTVNATSAGNVLIQTLGSSVNLGNGTDTAANLGLSQAELSKITANLLTIGNSTTNNIILSQNISWSSNITLISNLPTNGILSNSNRTFTQGSYALTATGTILIESATINYTILISSTAPVTYGTSVLLTASLTHSGGAFNTGAISFYNNGVLLGTSNITSDTANYSWSGMAAATYSNITATGNITGGTDNGSNTANAIVTPYNISVSANNQTKAYGAAVPALTFTNSPLVNGDTASVFTGVLATTATANSPGGYYPITIGTLSATPNYTISSFTNGTLSVAEELTTVVTTSTDSTDPYDTVVSLREAISYGTTLTGNQTVTFNSGLYTSNLSTITLTQGVLTINDNTGEISIEGPTVSSGNLLTISGNDASGIFQVLSEATISNITLSNGAGAFGTSPNLQGGAIYTNATLTLDRMTVMNSTANFGSGIYIDGGSVDSTDSSIFNSIYLANSGNLTVQGSSSTLGEINITCGTTNFRGGIISNLTQSGGDLTSVANITGFASLSGGTTSINYGGIVGGTTTVNNGSLTSNGVLSEGLQLNNGTATIHGGMVNRTGDNSAIVVNNGTLTAQNTTINGATGATGNTPTVYISGGSVSLSNNTLTLGNGARYLLFNNATAGVSSINNIWNGVNTTTANLSQLYDTVDRIIDSVDVGSLGLVRIKANNIYVTKESFYAPLGTTAADVQRGVDIASVGDTVNVETGDYNVTDNANNGVVSVSKNLTISGAGEVTTSVRAFVLNNGSNITTWSGISATSNVTIHSGAVINNATSTPTLVSLIDSNGSLIFDSGATYQAQFSVVNKNLTITSNTSASNVTINTICSGSANTAIILSGTGNITLTDLTLGGSGSALNATNTGSLTIDRLALTAGLANLTTGVKGAIANTGSFIYNGQTANTNYTFNATGMSTTWFNSQFLSFSPSGNVTINANNGNDTFTVNRIMLATTLNGGAGDDTFSLGDTDANASITQVNGDSGNNTLNAPVGRANVFTLTGNGTGNLNTSNVTSFMGIQNIAGGTTGDTVVVNRGAIFTSITGGGGIDTMQVDSIAGDTVNMTISGSNTGNITSTGGTSVGAYYGISKLIGTAGNDTFNFIDNASLLTGSLNGGTGTNAINYTGTTKPTFVNLSTGQATGVTTTTNTGVVSKIQDLFGGTGNDYLIGSSAANVMDGGAGNDTIIGLAGNDILVGNYGQDLINGGAGYDILIGGFINFVSTGMPNATLQEGLQTIMMSWITVSTELQFRSVSNSLNTASSSQYRLVGDTSLASTWALQTVFNDQATDTLIDIASSSVPTWFFATERITQYNDILQAGTTFTISKKTVSSKTARSAR